MSWDPYIDSIKNCGASKGGGIFDKNTGVPWTRYGELLDDNEIGKDIIECCKNPGQPDQRPVKVSGIKQMVIRADDTGLQAKKLTNSCVAAAYASTCVVVGVGGEGEDLKQINSKICALADYLRAQGY